MTPAQLLRAWIDLLKTRDDIRFTAEPSISPCEAPDNFPEDARAFAADAGRVSFAYELIKNPKKGGACFLDLSGQPAAGIEKLRINRKKVPAGSLHEFFGIESDAPRGPQVAWYRLPADGGPSIIRSVKDPVTFDSIGHYVWVGAGRGFGKDWQWAGESPLAAISAPSKTPVAELRDALIQRGATPDVADALVEWLAEDVSLLIPSSGVKKPAEPAATLIAYRIEDLPREFVESFPLTQEVRRCIFWVTRGGNIPVLKQLFKKVPEPGIPGVNEGLALARVVSRVLSEVTAAHAAVKAHGSFSFGFHSGDAATVQRWLQEHGVELLPVRDFLAKALILRVEGTSSPDATLQLTRAGDEWPTELYAKAPGIYVLDRSDSAATHFKLKERDRPGSVELRAADVPEGQVARVALGDSGSR